MPTDHTIAVFAAELILLLFVGRLLGEALNRVGQPAIFGQLLAGVVLGPSIFGALLPELRHSIFPGTPALKSMIDAVSQIGILLLLLLTGMETNLALVNRKRRAVISTSLAGIAVPFLSGFLLAYALPITLIPDPSTRLVTALFLGTALSISSVKIVAMVLMEVGAIRRDLGQLILATAILDDTIAWVLIAVIAGIAAHGTVSLVGLGTSLAGVLAFLLVSLTIGRRVVAWVIRWSNDNLTIEMPVITAILLVMLVMALSTELIGVHTALGAFVAGILVGQSPILTEHIEDELRGLIVAFFSPVFFAVAGLGMDLRTLLEPSLFLFTLAMIAVATVGKFLGATIGGHLGGLTWLEFDGVGDRAERARLHRGHHRHHRPVDGRVEQPALHNDRRHGRCHNDHDATHVTSDACPRPVGGGRTKAAREGRGRNNGKRSPHGARPRGNGHQRQWRHGRRPGRSLPREPAGAHHGPGFVA